MPGGDFFRRDSEVLRILLLERVPRLGQLAQFQRDDVDAQIDPADGHHLSQPDEILHGPLVFAEITIVGPRGSGRYRRNLNVTGMDAAWGRKWLAAAQVPNLAVAVLTLANRMQAPAISAPGGAHDARGV